MTLGTHLAFASVLYLGGATLFGYKPDGISWLLAAVASLLPDIDLPPAKIGRLFWFVSVPLEHRFGHRTLTHSLLVLVAVAALSVPLMAIRPLYFWRWSAAISRTCGWTCSTCAGWICSGPLRCGWSLRGIAIGGWKWGARGRWSCCPACWSRQRRSTRSATSAFAMACRPCSRTSDIACEQYQRVAGNHWYALELIATDNLTCNPFKGRFPVVGVWQNGLIVERDGELRWWGRAKTHHNLYPRQARLLRGEPLRVVAERVAMRGHTLRWLVSRIDQSRPTSCWARWRLRMGKGQP